MPGGPEGVVPLEESRPQEKSLEEVLSWRPSEEVSGQVASALDAAAQFHKAWADFQRRFDNINKALVERIGEQLKQEAVPEDTAEHDEPERDVRAKAREVAKMVRQSSCVLFYTGAGLSTAAGICDYRGPNGKWTLQAKGLKPRTKKVDELVPTSAHMGVVKMLEAGLAHYVVSTNIDGLHLRSGVPAEKLTEVHGNSFIEVCTACEREAERPFPVRQTIGKKTKETGGACEACGAPMRDTIVNFGDSLNRVHWERALEVAERRADLIIVLGSSIRVQPSASLVATVKNRGGRVCIVNKQKTGSDALSDVRVFGAIDAFFVHLLAALNLRAAPPPPPRKLFSAADKRAWRAAHGCGGAEGGDSEGEAALPDSENAEAEAVAGMRAAEEQAKAKAEEGEEAAEAKKKPQAKAKQQPDAGPAAAKVPKRQQRRASPVGAAGCGSSRRRSSSRTLPVLAKKRSVKKCARGK